MNNNSYSYRAQSLSSLQLSLYPNQKVLETSYEEQTFNTTNTLSRLIDIDTAKEKANHGTLV